MESFFSRDTKSNLDTVHTVHPEAIVEVWFPFRLVQAFIWNFDYLTTSRPTSRWVASFHYHLATSVARVWGDIGSCCNLHSSRFCTRPIAPVPALANWSQKNALLMDIWLWIYKKNRVNKKYWSDMWATQPLRFQDVLLRHPVDAASDQPLKAAAEALQRAGIHAPVLLAEAGTIVNVAYLRGLLDYQIWMVLCFLKNKNNVAVWIHFGIFLTWRPCSYSQEASKNERFRKCFPWLLVLQWGAWFGAKSERKLVILLGLQYYIDTIRYVVHVRL